ncbi:MAG: hypothetical protein RBU37_22720 [Myxococcota bacterium]|nr:hypothetical protein [Myxococcota bacterium]
MIFLGSDNGAGRRQVYAAHAYNVNTVTLLDKSQPGGGDSLRSKSGSPMKLAPGDVASRAAEIDPVASSVVLENPHAGNEPYMNGTGPKDGKNDGRFTLPLDAFLRNSELSGDCCRMPLLRRTMHPHRQCRNPPPHPRRSAATPPVCRQNPPWRCGASSASRRGRRHQSPCVATVQQPAATTGGGASG